MNENSIYKVPAQNLSKLQSKIKALSHRAAKIGSLDVGMEILDGYEDIENDDGTVTRLYTVRVTGEAPRLNGWRFVAKLQHLGGSNIVRAVPGETVPEQFRTVEPWCDHCNLHRERKDTYVVANDGEYKQVGSSCLADFTGHDDPHTAVQAAEYLIQADELCNDAMDDDWLGSSGGPFLIKIRVYLAYVAADIRVNGWTSRSNQMGATADYAMSTMLNKGKNGNGRASSDMEPSERDRGKAQKALAWVREELAARDSLSDYEWNLVRVCERDAIEASWIGYAASLIPAYTREMNQQAEREAQAESRHVGTIGQRQHFDGLTVTAIIPIDGRYGVTNLHKFQDADGNVFAWFASNAELDHGETYAGKGTVKTHDEYRGVRQTVLTRCKFEPVSVNDDSQQALPMMEITTVRDAIDFLYMRGWSVKQQNGSYRLCSASHFGPGQMMSSDSIIAKAQEVYANG